MESHSGKGTVLTLAQAREMLAADMNMTINERALLVILTDLERLVAEIESVLPEPDRDLKGNPVWIR